MGKALLVDIAVEGDVDEVVLSRILTYVGFQVDRVFGKLGKQSLKTDAPGYNAATQYSPWVVLVDLDDEPCPLELRTDWIGQPAPFMCFRVAVREVEAWLLADRERFAEFFRVRPARVPGDTESLLEPKRALVDTVRHSTRRGIKQDMVPRPGSGRAVGPAYSSRLREFVMHPEAGWRPDVAAQHCDSLERAIRCLRRLAETS